MTQEQFDKVKPWLDNNGINLTLDQLGRLDAEIQNAKGSAPVLIHMDRESLYFDASEQSEVVRGMLRVILKRNTDEGALALDSVIKSVAGYAIAATEDVVAELKHFIQYTLDAVKDLGNEKAVRTAETRKIVVPVKPNKFKS